MNVYAISVPGIQDPDAQRRLCRRGVTDPSTEGTSMSTILFGSISTLADTSELQRRAFNDAFAAYGLDWHWSRDDYVAMLSSNGGAQRIADYASSRGDDVDAAAVHAKKSEIFQHLLGSSSV